MSLKNLVTIVCIFKLVEASRQQLDIPSCNTIAQFEGHTLTMDLASENEFCCIDSIFIFFLYPAESDGNKCQWTQFSQQNSIACETSPTSDQKNIRAVFEHVNKGHYCLAVYRNTWTNSLPICDLNVPFYVETESTEMDVRLWNPIITLQQQGFNDLLIQLGVNHSNGYNFSKFDIELHAVDETITDCDLLSDAFQTKTHTMSVSREAFILRNLTEGYYCVQVTPVDVRCINPLSVTYLPCTRSSNTIHITFSRDRDYQKTVVVGSIAIFLLSCLAVIAVFLKTKHGETGNMERSAGTEDDEMSSVSIFLLHSNDEPLRSSAKMLKENLFEKLPSCEIDDYTDERQWESVAQEGISWFLSRLNEKQKFIIVIEPFLEGDLYSQREFSENYYFHFVLQQLQSLASSSDYQRVLTVWFQNEFKLDHAPFQRLGNPFTNFLIPKDFDCLVNHIKNWKQGDFV